MYDFSLIEDYHKELGKEFLLDLSKRFLESTPGHFKTLHQSIENDDNKTFSRIAHSLKSNVKTFGANDLSEIFCTLEMESKDKPLSEMKNLLTQAEEEYLNLVKELKSYLINKYK